MLLVDIDPRNQKVSEHESQLDELMGHRPAGWTSAIGQYRHELLGSATALDKNATMDILMQRPVDTDAPGVLDDIYSWGREPFGEYFFYFAADAKVVSDGKVNATVAPHSHIEAYVTFETDAVAVEREMQHRVASLTYGSTQDGRAFLDGMLGRPIGDWGHYPQYPVIGALSSDGSSASWFDFNRWGSASLGLTFVRLEQDRAIHIKAFSNDPHAVPRQLLEHWHEIVSVYAQIPYKRFTGAIRM
ncbi:hypothetical protein EJP67_28085 [Variovorax guangxiensis]|uniref:Uncharacterized protein n=1 Tax=Variovorax guangxiensis TaxID=1775474 RepID=A0A433MT03_9BURK|nr:hypothetical protein [Variovorax guangxiensis]RUR70924.1 hypothetical protein EJP67_28085 [Variovorax guangxiensis]